ncbi:MAG: metallophosphoesterase family protein [Actinobacteria bacterium]|nr:metallophosphoesterase family protein [Actinomycetota bacterium]
MTFASPSGLEARRVGVLADVHGNDTALAAVLAELERESTDLLVHCGDLTWGPEPRETLALLEPWASRLHCVRGNGDRKLLELADGSSVEPTPREAWMVERHGSAGRKLLATFRQQVVVEIDGIGRTLFCHGSPRSDEECVTVETPVDRLREALAGIDAEVVVSAHTHLQYERSALSKRLLNPGSVGMPYEDERGAYWALLGPGVEFRRTEYDLDEAVTRYRASGDPSTERMVELLLSPPTPAEVIEDAETRVFAE